MTRLALCFDLAERHTAACLLDEDRPLKPLWEGVLDVGHKDAPWSGKNDLLHIFTEHAVSELKNWTGPSRVAGPRFDVWIEDIHPFAVNPKPALRLQGSLMTRLADMDVPFDYVTPTRWQGDLGYRKVKGVSSKGWAKDLCTRLGYELPEAASGKALQDHRDAYLMARWSLGLRIPKPVRTKKRAVR